MPAWLAALVGVPALLVAAKAHGRQVRLEREAAGYHSVEFGGSNPEFVERLWRRDRIRFWSIVPLVAIVLGGALFFALRSWALVFVAALLWAPIVGFFYAGLRSFAAQRGRGGVAWWVGAIVLSIASAAVSLL